MGQNPSENPRSHYFSQLQTRFCYIIASTSTTTSQPQNTIHPSLF